MDWGNVYMVKSNDRIPNLEIVRAKTREGSMKVFEDIKTRYINVIAEEIWQRAKIGKNDVLYTTTLKNSVVRKAFESAMKEYRLAGYTVSENDTGNLGVSVTISWPLDL
jgi:hypothetical protein